MGRKAKRPETRDEVLAARAREWKQRQLAELAEYRERSARRLGAEATKEVAIGKRYGQEDDADAR